MHGVRLNNKYMKETQTQWIVKQKEVSEEVYENMLGALPPARMTHNAFLVGEPNDHIAVKRADGKMVWMARYDMYFMEAGKYYFAGAATTKDFDLWEMPICADRACQNHTHAHSWQREPIVK
jgi:hypothetical protein